KCVANLGLEAEVRDAFSESGLNLALMHRNPLSVVPSTCRLSRAFHRAYSDVDVDMSANPAGLAGMMMRCLNYRINHPSEVFHDICYDNVRTDIQSVIAGIYDFCGVTPTDQTYANVMRWEAENPQNKHGAWDYSAEAYGFTNDDIRREFALYAAWVQSEGICNWAD
ncbi:MAG: hypothetical protein HOE54_05405, partial [Gammaproteobacteria bacterium]|nr:hypothetical protein [Gammaproteobacteria bacterium]